MHPFYVLCMGGSGVPVDVGVEEHAVVLLPLVAPFLCPYKAVGGRPPLGELPITILLATSKCHKLDIND